MTTIPPPQYSPWDHVQDAELLLPGVYWVSTAGHGGMMIHQSQLTNLTPLARGYGEGFGNTWLCYEEDCDWAIPMFDWPDLLEPMGRYGKRSALDMLGSAFLTLSAWRPIYLASKGYRPNPERLEYWNTHAAPTDRFELHRLLGGMPHEPGRADPFC